MPDPVNPVPDTTYTGADVAQFAPVPDPIPPVAIPIPFFTSVKEMILKVLKNWWVWIILALFVLLGLSECRSRSIQNKWQKAIESEIKKQTSQVIKDQQDRQDIYEKDLRTVQNKLKALDKASKVIDSKLSKTGDLLSEIRNKKMSDSDIDRRLNELFGPSNSMGPSRSGSGNTF